MRNYGLIALDYAKKVTGGKIAACKWVKLACQRHINDLKQSKGGKAAFVFDEEKADDACFFIEQLPHVKGEWARAKELITLQPWQVFIIASIFGWVNKSNGRRRYREAYIEVPRKNGKSVLAAGIGLFMLTADNEPGSEVYSGATSEKQAWEVFRPAKEMAARTPALCEAFGLVQMKSNLSVPDTSSRFEPVIGKPGDGASPHCAIVDEYHEHQSPELYETMKTGTGARSQPLVFIITTAGSNIAGPCYQKRLQSQKVLDSLVKNDSLFSMIYTIDEGDNWTKLANWKKANPNYGVSVNDEFIKQQLKEATTVVSRQNSIKCKHLNIWTQARNAWLDMDRFRQCAQEGLKLEDFAGERCYIGLDLGLVSDICSKAYIFPKNGKFYCFWKNYLPQAQLDSGKNNHYWFWAEQGWLSVPDGRGAGEESEGGGVSEIIPLEMVFEEIKADFSRFQVEGIGYDPWHARQLVAWMENAGMAPEGIYQSAKNLSEPMKVFENWVKERKFVYNGDPVAEWMFANVVVKEDWKENILPTKEAPEAKIDGVDASLMALCLLLNKEGLLPDVKDFEFIFI